jgi:hypothetical protein
MLTEAQKNRLEALKTRMASGVMYPSADAYYADKDAVRTLEAQAQGKSRRQTDPMGFWYGGQSN